jgi:hypothetical protein
VANPSENPELNAKNKALLGEKWRNPRATAAEKESILNAKENNNSSGTITYPEIF